ncbi:MAG: hypothetical protein K0S33_2862 [Bacteroidetes bacterium]|jgi:hypothetical protein|nr:hypothetical protein [Bacteroidota bacterium]
MKHLYEVINQLSALESRLNNNEEYQRYFTRCKQSFGEMGISYYSPINEKYSETRTDVEANITGEGTKHMVITQVIKPVIVHDGAITQRGIVIVEGK